MATVEEQCDSLTEYWVGCEGGQFLVYMRCETALNHEGKHRNKSGKKWDDSGEVGFLGGPVGTERVVMRR